MSNTRIEIRNADTGTVYHVAGSKRGAYASEHGAAPKVYSTERRARAAFRASSLSGCYRSLCGHASTVHYVAA